MGCQPDLTLFGVVKFCEKNANYRFTLRNDRYGSWFAREKRYGRASMVLNVADFTCFLQKFAAGCP